MKTKVTMLVQVAHHAIKDFNAGLMDETSEEFSQYCYLSPVDQQQDEYYCPLHEVEIEVDVPSNQRADIIKAVGLESALTRERAQHARKVEQLEQAIMRLRGLEHMPQDDVL